MATYSNNDGDLIMGAAIGAVMGVVWFFKGFKELKIKRTVQNIPTSKINTGAVGTDVEIKGNIIAEKERLVTALISGQQCAIYHIEIQVEGAKINRKGKTNNCYFSSSDLDEIPDSLRKSLKTNQHWQKQFWKWV